MALPDLLGQCPVCDAELTVTRLHCPSCETTIAGRFGLGRFQRLSPELLAFLEVFVKNRGVIKDVEAELGISYPTVRSRLDEVLRAMGFAAAGDERSPRQIRAQAREERRQILEELKSGRITADEAASRLATTQRP